MTGWKVVVVAVSLIGVAHAQQYPKSGLTPGEADPKLTQKVICAKTFSTGDVRSVSDSLKRRVYESYGIGPHDGYCKPAGCEVDHLISLELGGSNSQRNLWPQPYAGKWNAHDKDKLENRLHKLVCTNQITLEQAQHEISFDWIAAYKKYIQP